MARPEVLFHVVVKPGMKVVLGEYLTGFLNNKIFWSLEAKEEAKLFVLGRFQANYPNDMNWEGLTLGLKVTKYYPFNDKIAP